RDFWASLVLADGKFYATDQEGDTYVFAAKPEFEEPVRNSLGEHVNASLAISDGDIFIRSYEHLWCISARKRLGSKVDGVGWLGRDLGARLAIFRLGGIPSKDARPRGMN